MTSPRPVYDVAIAGAGLAGGLLALGLSRRGARVALLDPGTFPRDKLCGEFLSPEAWGVLARFGLDDEVRASGYQPIRRVRISTPRGTLLVAGIEGPDGLPGIGLSRSYLDNLILHRAAGAGTEVSQATRVGGAIVEGGCVVGLHARGPDGPIEVRARLTIAAGGRHSSLVKQTGTTRGRSLFRPGLFGLKRHLHAPEAVAEPAGGVGLHVVRGGYGGASRVEGSLTNLCALLPESALKRRRGDLDRVATEVLGANPCLDGLLRGSTPAGAWRTVSGVRVESSRADLPGILYAGDCRGTVDPLGGQGMTMALLGAEQLVPFALRSLAGGPSLGIAREAEAAWHARFDRRVHLCRAFHHALVHPAAIDMAAALRSLAPRLLSACYRLTRDPAPAAVG